MSDEYPHYRGTRRSYSPAFPIPDGAAPMALATPDGPAPRPQPRPDRDDQLVPYERAIDLIKNVVVIVTCAAILYALWSVYSALAQVSDRLNQLPL
jgi:hypothetical protein